MGKVYCNQGHQCNYYIVFFFCILKMLDFYGCSNNSFSSHWFWLSRNESLEQLKSPMETINMNLSVIIILFLCLKSTADLRQFSSSDLSLQSASPSHFQFTWTHSPLPHWNSPTGQRGFWGSVRRLHRSMDSSDLSLQSGSPSQLHRAGMHSELLQRNSCWPQVGAEHFSSSLASPQSSSPSHTKVWATHFPLRHGKSLLGHALASAQERGQVDAKD